HGPLSDGELELSHLSGPAQAKRDRPSDALGPQGAQHRMPMADGRAIPGDDDIALLHAGKRARTPAVDAHDHRALLLAAFHGDRLQAEAKIAPRDAAVGLEPGRDPLDGRGRDDQHAPAWP